MKPGKRAGQHFGSVGALRPQRTAFDLSHEHKTTFNMGLLYPVDAFEVYPGEEFTIFLELFNRFQPMITPIIHAVDCYAHAFYCPLRLLYGSVHSIEQYPTEPPMLFENFITGGQDGSFSTLLPRWVPSSTKDYKKTQWDYYGFPMRENGTIPPALLRDDFTPVDHLRRTYNFIWNEYYRDQALQDKVPWSNEDLLRRCWEKDYFTISRPSRQLGQALAIPLSGMPRVKTINSVGISSNAMVAKMNDQHPSHGILVAQHDDGTFPNYWPNSNYQDTYALRVNMADGVGTFDVNDLRQIFALQKWQERNMRAGNRFREFIPAHFGISIRDERLDRPEYIGGIKSPVIISEVLQTEGSTDSSPQANMAGHGLTSDTTRVGKYFVREHGVIMIILSFRPRTAYMNQIHRSWLRRTRYDYQTPEFNHLSEQAIYKGEVQVLAENSNQWDPFGFVGMYDELRYLPSRFTGDMRDTMRYWHLGRVLDSSGGNGVVLNSDFVTCNPRSDIFAVQQVPDPNNDNELVDVDNIIGNVGIRIKGIRNLPYIAEPGLVDHF